MWRDSQGLVSKLYGFKENKTGQTGDKMTNGALSRNNSESSNADESYMDVSGDVEIDSVPDLKEQVTWLKNELCKILEEKRSVILRAEELETALVEMVKQDNRRELSAKRTLGIAPRLSLLRTLQRMRLLRRERQKCSSEGWLGVPLPHHGPFLLRLFD